MTRILITGATGFFGWNAVRHFTVRGYEVVAGFHTLPHYLHNVADCQPVALDIADGTATEEVVNRFQPNLILHAAALVRPQIDIDVERVHSVNADGTYHLAIAAARRDIPIVYVSTDLVYPSDAGVCTEETPVALDGATVYAMSKLRGEERLREAGGRWIIIRPSLMYGVGSHRSGGFNGFMEEKWGRGEAAPLFTDQYRSFLYVDDLSRAVEQVAVIRPAWNELYVCGGAERMSRAEFGLRYADARGIDRGMCRPMKAHELSGYVGGPSDIILDTAKLSATGWKPTATETALRQIVQHLVPAQ